MNACLNQHIEAIYDAVTDENGWQPLLEQLTQDLDFRSGVFSLESCDLSGVKARTSTGYSEEEEREVFSYYHQHDIWTRTLFNSPSGKFYSSNVMVPMAKLKSHEFYDFCQKFDIAYSIGATLISEGSLRLKLGFQHTHDQGPTDKKLPYLNSLLPHLTRAVELRRRIESHASPAGLLSAVVDRMADAILILNEHGQVQYFNLSADKQLSQSKLISMVSGKFRICQKLQQVLDQRVAECALMAKGCAAKSHRDILLHDNLGQPKFLVKVDPISGSDPVFGMPYRQSFCLVTIVDVSAVENLDRALIQEVYTLTDRELALATALASGYTLNQISTISHRSPNTLRTQLKSIFVKTGARSQPQLVSLLLRQPFAANR